MMRALCGFTLTALAVASFAQADSPQYPRLAPIHKAEDPKQETIPGEYIITLHDDYDIVEHLEFHIGRSPRVNPSTIRDWYEDAQSYFIKDVTEDALDHIRHDPGVLAVAENKWYHGMLDDPVVPRDFTEEEPSLHTEDDALDYIRHDHVPGSTTMTLMDCETSRCTRIEDPALKSFTSAREVYPSRFTDPASWGPQCQHLAPLTETNIAGCDTSGEYLVVLYMGYSMHHHLQYIRKSPRVDPSLFVWPLGYVNWYYTVNMTDDAIDYIRRDTGVASVVEKACWYMHLLESHPAQDQEVVKLSLSPVSYYSVLLNTFLL
ncbi:hypothetical protein K461DRAFT_79583 [Myriangium duriaei CBS 260.36]|uniref:Uncharacterized protein n=1 Tax=Myriangium duriaei CBS 260.36 TaxID=1168546 RepID=A0A9P4MI87_9PEZI|nr:hypothetical protein K461DRAFT_79583 [Myriangium duriaei CBS 260.36]